MKFQPGARVRYVPPHAKGDETSTYCETGDVVEEFADGFVAVQFEERQWPVEVAGKFLRRWGRAE